MNNKTLYAIIAFLVLIIAVLVIWKDEAKAPTLDQYTQTASSTETSSTTGSTTTQTTKTVTTPTAISQPTKVKVGSVWATVVYYTKSGFSPKTITIKKGDLVRFVNHSNLSMRIVSNTYQNAPLYPGLDELKSVGYGKTFDFLFDRTGTWGYHNLNGDILVSGYVIVQ